MINLLCYTDPSKNFATEEDKVMAKIQIDNALDLGWKREDILIAADFEYEYNGVKSVAVEDKNPITWNLTQGKIVAITQLFAKGLIKQGQLYWFHDFDAFQLESFTEEELELSGFDMGLTDSTHRMFGGGSFFFNHKTKDIFDWTMNNIYQNHSDEERSFEHLAKTNELNMKNRYKMLDHTYNLGVDNFQRNYDMSQKPIRVAHFHPYKKHHVKLFRDILPERFKKIFRSHGID
ncbi:hypothetical protein HYW44_00095 [Candidatus Daviesbacteria bacterium]|nr:hypothetical protein [Candidatus Daviesbacteria bacterium]